MDTKVETVIFNLTHSGHGWDTGTKGAREGHERGTRGALKGYERDTSGASLNPLRLMPLKEWCNRIINKTIRRIFMKVVYYRISITPLRRTL